MTKLITIIAMFVASIVSAQTQFDQGMKKALQTWKNGNSKEALVQFEKIASVEKINWLPNYYIAFINTTQAFGEKDKTKIESLLNAAQKAQDVCNELAQDNPEVLVLQAMIHTAWIVYDPMTNGQRLYQDVLYLYGKAEKIAPEKMEKLNKLLYADFNKEYLEKNKENVDFLTEEAKKLQEDIQRNPTGFIELLTMLVK